MTLEAGSSVAFPLPLASSFELLFVAELERLLLGLLFGEEPEASLAAAGVDDDP